MQLRAPTIIPEGFNMLHKPAVKSHKPKWQRQLFKWINHNVSQIILGILLMLSLFMAESWVLGNAPDSTNDAMFAVLLAIFIIFVIETIILSIVQDGYFNSFFFWMDVIGTISILLDIGWIADAFIPSGAVSSSGNVLRATRAAKLGARYGRLLRLMRLMKFTRYLPCFMTDGGDTFEPTMSAIKRVSEELSSMLSLRTAALVMLLVIVVPFLSYELEDWSPTAWVDNIKLQAKNESTTYYDLQNIARKCDNYYSPKDMKLLYLYVESPFQPTFEESYKTRDVLRESNKVKYESHYYVLNSALQAAANEGNSYAANALSNATSTTSDSVRFTVKLDIDNTLPNQLNSMFGILLIILVIIVLVTFTAAFSSAVNRTVVQPLEKMMSTLRNSAMLMITSLKQLEPEKQREEEEKEAEEKRKRREKRQRRRERLGSLSSVISGGSAANSPTKESTGAAGAAYKGVAAVDAAAPAGAGGDIELANTNTATGAAIAEDSDDDDDYDDDDDTEASEDLEAAMLEKMVEKLSRIVKTIIPNNEIEIDENIDKTTSNWLSQAYSTGPAVKKDVRAVRAVKMVMSIQSEKKRIADLEEQCTAVSLEALNSWNFNVLDHANSELCEIMLYMFSYMNLLNDFQIPRAKFRNFLNEICGRYVQANTYHNFKHGCDVCHTSYRLLRLSHLSTVLTTLEVFSVLVGALAHDVGHPGVNNAFLVKSKHDLALKHNDRSPLENMHCVTLYEVLGNTERNIFAGLSDTEWREARQIILTIILGTDMSHHFEQISKTQLFLEVNGDDTKAFCAGEKDVIDCFSDEKNRIFVMELVLHCSDISNPFKPYDLSAKWADLVVEEFCLQGDKEKELGLEVSPMCDRDTIQLCNMQMGFIEFVVAPLIIAFVNLLPTLHEIGATMEDNFVQWGSRRMKELMPDGHTGDKPEDAVKLEERLQKFKDKMAFVHVLEKQQQRRRLSLQKGQEEDDE